MGREKAGEKVTDVHFDPKSTVQVYCIASFPGFTHNERKGTAWPSAHLWIGLT